MKRNTIIALGLSAIGAASIARSLEPKTNN